MKKMIYVAVSDRIYNSVASDSFNLAVSFDPDDCRKALSSDIAHLLPKELRKSAHHIDGYLLNVVDGQTAQEVYNNYLDEGDYTDPDFYEEVK